MNTDYLQPLQRRVGDFPIELPAALLMAGAVAFVTMVLPDWRFESIVAATGLPAIVGAAQPPLGQTARVVAALVGASLAFAAVWMGLRALDRRAPPSDFPAFRAADLHPDAPRRRPIRAGAEFGTPVDELPPIEEQLNRRKTVEAESLPSFLAPQQQDAGPAAFTPPQSAPETTHDAEPEPASFGAARAIPVELAEPAFAPPRESLLRSEPEHAFPPASDPVSVLDDSATAPDAADGDPFWEEISPKPAPASIRTDDARLKAEFPIRAVAATQDPDEEESVSDLMERLESLARRGSRPSPQAGGGAAQDELRQVLGDLNRTTGRNV